MSQDENGVTAIVKSLGDSETETIKAKFLVGCDGAHSLVRHSLGLEFEGGTFERLFYVADVDIDWSIFARFAARKFGERRLTAFFPDAGRKAMAYRRHLSGRAQKDAGEIFYRRDRTADDSRYRP